MRKTFRFDYSRSGLNPLQQVEFLDGGTSRSPRPIAPAPSCPSLGRNAEGALPIRSDAEVYGALLQAGASASFSFRKGDAGYLVPATGGVELGRVQVAAREGVVIENEKVVAINALKDSEIILVVTAK